ncbi:MAG: bifunctional riboflavin kinase/FAD synthetase [Hungatella sp.]
MQCFSNTREFKIEEPTVVTIGKFDGRHKGHQKLLKRMLELKEQYGYKTAIFTFDTVPSARISDKPQTVITTNRERRDHMEHMGIDYLVEYPFTQEAAHLSPEEFIRHILVEQMNAKAMVVGTDCGFGYQRAGNAAMLQKLSSQYGYHLEVIEKAQDDHRDISSTYVKEELDRGNIEKANALLGEPYAIHGTVVHGNHIGGSVLGFPTVNILPPPEKHLPPFGVYVSQVELDGSIYGGITNIGRKPTLGMDSPISVETFIFDLNQDLYGKNIAVQLLHFERPEQKFDSLEQLKQQLKRDQAFGLAYRNEK